MTQLEAINTMLSYINENPVTQSQLSSGVLQSVVLAHTSLSEVIRSVNSNIGTSFTDISSFDDLLVDYMVKRASESLYGRVFGFEDKGLEYIINDKNQTLGNVAKYIIKQLTTGFAQSRHHLEMSKLILASNSFESMSQIGFNIQQTLVNMSIPSYITDPVDIDEYKMMIIKITFDNELGLKDKERIVENGLKALMLKTLNQQSVSTLTASIAANLIKLIDFSSQLSITETINMAINKVTFFREEIESKYSFLANSKVVVEYMSVMLELESGNETAYLKRKEIVKAICEKVFSWKYEFGHITHDEFNILNKISASKNIETIYAIDEAIEKVKVILDKVRKDTLSEGWQENTITVTLQPNTDGYIPIPKSYLLVDGVSQNVKIRDWKLFDSESFTFIFESGVSCEVFEDLPIDDITHSLKNLIVSKATYESYIAISIKKDEMPVLDREYKRALVVALRNNARNIDGNVLTNTYISGILDRGGL
ncbi:MAG: hypothetical protein ACPG9K_00905 [Poseidonibacter sp.]